jgi:hypothetical protein
MGLLDTLIGPVTNIIDKIIPDKDQAAKLAHEIATTKVVGDQLSVGYVDYLYSGHLSYSPLLYSFC